MTPTAFLSAFAEAIANDGALVLLVLAILVMGARKTWVWGWNLDTIRQQLTDERVDFMGRINDMRAERDHWRSIAMFHSANNPDHPPPDVPHSSDD